MSHRAGTIARVKRVEFAQYMLLVEHTGKRRRSRWKMTREEALARDSGAVVCPGSEEVRQLPETPEEIADCMFAMSRRPPGPPSGE